MVFEVSVLKYLIADFEQIWRLDWSSFRKQFLLLSFFRFFHSSLSSTTKFLCDKLWMISTPVAKNHECPLQSIVVGLIRKRLPFSQRSACYLNGKSKLKTFAKSRKRNSEISAQQTVWLASFCFALVSATILVVCHLTTLAFTDASQIRLSTCRVDLTWHLPSFIADKKLMHFRLMYVFWTKDLIMVSARFRSTRN